MNLTAAGFVWRTGRGILRLDKPCVMGILNVTPDSFSDGGKYLDPDRAFARALALEESKIIIEHVILRSPGEEQVTLGKSAIVAFDNEEGKKTKIPEKVRELVRRQLGFQGH